MSVSRFVHVLFGAAVLSAVLMLAGAGPRAQSAPGAAAVVAHPDVHESGLSLAQLRDVLLGDQQHWPGGQRIVVFRPDHGAEWDTVLSKSLRLSAPVYVRRLSAKRYAGELAVVPRTIDAPVELRRMVAQTPGAIGILPAGEVDGSVKVIRIDNLNSADSGYPLVP